MDVINLIAECAKIPSFSTEEHHLHPFIIDFIKKNTPGKIELIHKNNVIVSVPSGKNIQTDRNLPMVALTAHLDKINHFGDTIPGELPVSADGTRITGQLDDATGVGICLYIAFMSQKEKFPPLLLLFSEMEEHGLYINPFQGVVSGLGAVRISRHLLITGRIPALLLTIDTTPFYQGTNGISLYSRFWEKCAFDPSDRIVAFTEKLEDYFLSRFPEIKHQNNTNDYITYGRHFNTGREYTVPSIALEPAIYPYHTKDEGVFISDVHQVVAILRTFLLEFPFHLMGPIL